MQTSEALLILNLRVSTSHHECCHDLVHVTFGSEMHGGVVPSVLVVLQVTVGSLLKQHFDNCSIFCFYRELKPV